MKPVEFFTYLVAYLKAFTISGSKVFGENVYFVPTFPAQQINDLASPSAFVMDMGATPYEFSHRLVEQAFSVGFWLEKPDRMGQDATLEFLRIEESLLVGLRGIKTLNSTKVLLVEGPKKQFIVSKGNYPALSRSWSFSVLLEL
jgi:hypothetical protein